MQLYTVQLQCTDRIAKVVQMRLLPTLHVRHVMYKSEWNFCTYDYTLYSIEPTVNSRNVAISQMEGGKF